MTHAEYIVAVLTDYVSALTNASALKYNSSAEMAVACERGRLILAIANALRDARQ